MTIIKRTGYLTTNNCDAMVAALPTLPDAAGKEYRNSDAGGNQVSSYKILRYYSYPESLKTAWKTYITSEVSEFIPSFNLYENTCKHWYLISNHTK
jgi:hypothetical protein